MGKFRFLLAALASVLISPVAKADDAPPQFKFDLHGIAGTSFYMQNNPDFILNGQGPLILKSQNASSGISTSGFDVRQTRLSFQVTGPKVFNGADTKAVIETDFFNLDGPGGYGEIGLMSRLRLAYSELNWGDTQIRFGQDWELLFNEFPTSLGHMAFPVTYFAGLSGWRAAGIEAFHTFHMSGDSSLQAAVSVIRSDWEAPADFGTSSSTLLNVSSGQLSNMPGFEGRLKWMNGRGFLYAAAHYSQVDGSRFSALATQPSATVTTIATPTSRRWDVEEGKIGGKYAIGDFTLQGDLYGGKNTAPLIGEELQWYTANDVKEWGGWGQAGYNFTKEMSVWGVYGTTRSNLDDVKSAGGGRYRNTVYGGMFQYRDGSFGVGPEFYWVKTSSTVAAGAGAPDGNMSGTQLLVSGMYFF